MQRDVPRTSHCFPTNAFIFGLHVAFVHVSEIALLLILSQSSPSSALQQEHPLIYYDFIFFLCSSSQGHIQFCVCFCSSPSEKWSYKGKFPGS